MAKPGPKFSPPPKAATADDPTVAAIKAARAKPINLLELPPDVAAAFVRLHEPIPPAPDPERGRGRPRNTVELHVRRKGKLLKRFKAQLDHNLSALPSGTASQRLSDGDRFRRRVLAAVQKLTRKRSPITSKRIAQLLYRSDREGRAETDRHVRRAIEQLRREGKL